MVGPMESGLTFCIGRDFMLQLVALRSYALKSWYAIRAAMKSPLLESPMIRI
jgi:hypothetical protein